MLTARLTALTQQPFLMVHTIFVQFEEKASTLQSALKQTFKTEILWKHSPIVDFDVTFSLKLSLISLYCSYGLVCFHFTKIRIRICLVLWTIRLEIAIFL